MKYFKESFPFNSSKSQQLGEEEEEEEKKEEKTPQQQQYNKTGKANFYIHSTFKPSY